MSSYDPNEYALTPPVRYVPVRATTSRRKKPSDSDFLPPPDDGEIEIVDLDSGRYQTPPHTWGK